ncbi:MAG: hypothetical protein M3P27_10230 [Acidobacteriota bacterium]|nr:hypothetical protein [Acidobacteriota bacterium]
MAAINYKRVLGGGLAAGLLYDIFEFALSPLFIGNQYDVELSAIRHTQPSAAGYTFFISWGFVIGLIAIFLYAAVRPRFGPGPRTAARVALALWIIGDLMPHVGEAFMGIFTLGLMLKFAAQQLLIMLASTIFGAWLYRESDSAGG